MFISSVAAFTGGIVGPHYAASKAGLHGLTHFLASRLAASGVTVNAGRVADGQVTRLPAGAARPELDPGHDGDGHQQPGGEQDVQDEAEDGQGHDGG
ncbi:MAG: SDR family NAD(P)-dependent oxidoreductase [Streptosporangiaceae bacterium]